MADESDNDGVEATIEISGGTEAMAEELRRIFDGEDEDVVFAHAFGGVDTVAILAKLGQSTIGKLLTFAATLHATRHKTVVKIGKTSIELQGFEAAEIQAMLASDGFERAVRSVKAP